MEMKFDAHEDMISWDRDLAYKLGFVVIVKSENEGMVERDLLHLRVKEAVNIGSRFTRKGKIWQH
jgi:hypothetical protein